jgi:Ca2+-binding RTX toxin-like protein
MPRQAVGDAKSRIIPVTKRSETQYHGRHRKPKRTAFVWPSTVQPFDIPFGLASFFRDCRYRESQKGKRRRTSGLRLEALEDRTLLSVSLADPNPEWIPQGPGPVEQGQVQLLGTMPNNPVSGAIQAIAVDPTDTAIIYVGTVNGGVWKTTTAKTKCSTNPDAYCPTWTPITDQFPSLSINSLAISPLNRLRVFAGTGAASSASEGVGRGLLKTDDGGNTWELFGHKTFRGANIVSIVPSRSNEKVVLLATDLGAFRNFRDVDTDGKFTNLSNAPGVNFPAGSVTDLVADPTDGNRYYVAIADLFNSANNGIYRIDTSTNPWTWARIDSGVKVRTPITLPGSSMSNASRIRLAVYPDTGALWAGVVVGGAIQGVFQSTNPASNDIIWRAMDFPKTTQNIDLNGNGVFTDPKEKQAFLPNSGQGDKHFSIIADPTDPKVVYIGSNTQDDTGAWAAAVGTTPAKFIPGCNDFVGNLWRGRLDPAAAPGSPGSPGSQWEPIVCDFAKATAPHADSRAMAFAQDPAGTHVLFEVDDGGIYRLDSPGDQSVNRTNRKWSSLIGNLQISEFYSVAYDSKKDTILGGMQDTGTAEQAAKDMPGWTENIGGDGGVVAVDNTGATATYYFTSQNLGKPSSASDPNSFCRVPGDHVNNDGDARIDNCNEGTRIALNVTGTGKTLYQVDKTIQFVQPYLLNAVAPSRMLIGTDTLYESTDQGQNLKKLQKVGTVVAMAYGGSFTADPDPTKRAKANVAYVATIDNKLFVRDDTGGSNVAAAGSFKQVEFPGNSTIKDIVLDPDDWHKVYVVKADKVYFNANAGKKGEWKDLTANLPTLTTELGGLDLRTIEFIRNGGNFGLLVGGRGGVFRAINPTPGHPIRWTKFGGDFELHKNLPNTLVTDLRYDSTDNILVAGTFGRGAWTVKDANQFVVFSSALSITVDSTLRIVTLQRSAQNPLLLNVLEDGALSQTVPLAAFERIEVKGPASPSAGIVLQIDTTNGNITLPGTIDFTGTGLAGDQLQVCGNPKPSVKQKDSSTVLIEIGGSKQTVNLIDVSAPVAGCAPNARRNIALLQGGLRGAAHWSAGIDDPTVVGAAPVAGTRLGGVLNGRQIAQRKPIGLPHKPQEGDFFQETSGEVLGRIIEEGLGGFSLEDIDSEDIPDLDTLRQRLDGLDSIAGNVTKTENADGSVVFKVQVVNKPLSGTADLDLEALAGSIEVFGTVELSADVTLNLTFGVDADGFFFIESDASAEPEIVARNFRVSGDVAGSGRLGFLGVTVSGGTLTVAPGVSVAIDLHDPGTDAADGMLRLDELGPMTSDLVTVIMDDDPSADDVVFTGTFGVSLFDFNLPDLSLTLRWPDINHIENVQIDPTATLEKFLHLDAQQIVAGLSNFAGTLQEIAGAAGIDLMNEKIPLVNESLGEILGSQPQQVQFKNDASAIPPVQQVLDVSEVFPAGAENEFVVTLNNVNPLKLGVAAGNPVKYKAAAGSGCNMDLCEGAIARVDFTGFAVTFTEPTHTPDGTNPEFQITASGSLQNQLAASLGQLTDIGSLSIKVPTLQDLIQELSDRTGVDLFDKVQVTPDGSALQIDLTINPDPIRFSKHLDFGDSVHGLKFDASGTFNVQVDPSFAITVGVRLSENLSASQRFFIVENATPEITLAVSANLNDPAVTGSVGFLDVKLRELASATGEMSQCTGVAENDGICLSATVTVNLADPAASGTPEDDQRITLAELTPGNLTSVFVPGITGSLDIDGLELIANVGDGLATGTVTVSLDGTSDTQGRIDGLDDFPRVLGALAANMQTDLDFAGFDNFNNLSPQMILEALELVINQLRSLGAGGVFDTQLPLINKSVSDLVDMGQAFLAKFGSPDGGSVSTVQFVENFLNSKLDANPNDGMVPDVVNVVFDRGNPSDASDDDLRFTFTFSHDFSPADPIPLALDLGGNLGFVTFEASGGLTLGATASLGLTLGFRTGSGISSLMDRIFLGSDSSATISLLANAGYDVSDSGSAPGELDFSASVGPLHLDVVNARALLQLSGTADVQNGGDADNRLTLREIADNVAGGQFGNVVDLRFNGQVQALVPIDGDGDGTVSPDPAVLDAAGSADARVEVAGELTDFSGITFDFTDLAFHHINDGPVAGNATDTMGQHTHDTADVSDPLTSDELPDNTIQVFAHNIDGLIANGFLNFNSLIDGLQTLIAWGQELLGLDVLNFKLPIIGLSVQDAFDFISRNTTVDCSGSGGENPLSLREVVTCIIQAGAGLGESSTHAAVKAAAESLRDALKDIPGIEPIGDANVDGHVDDDDLLSLFLEIADATVTTSGNFFTLSKAGADFVTQGIVTGDIVRYFSGLTPTHGTVTGVGTGTLTVEMDDASRPPSGDDFFIDTFANAADKRILSATFLVKFSPDLNITLDPFTLDLGIPFLNISSDFEIFLNGNLTLLLGFGLSKADGFFLKTEFDDIPFVGPVPVELSLNGQIRLDGTNGVDPANPDLTLTVGLLDFQAELDEPGAEDDRLDASFQVDLLGGVDAMNDDGILSLPELLDLANLSDHIDPALGVDAHLNVPLTLGGEAGQIDLPKLAGTFVLDWDASPTVDSASDSDGVCDASDATVSPFDITSPPLPDPCLALNDVRLDIGPMLTTLAGPLFQAINRANLIEPVLGFLDDPLPIIGLTPLEMLIAPLPESQQRVIEFLFDVGSLVSETASQAGEATTHSLSVNFGNIEVANASGAQPDLPDNPDEDGTASSTGSDAGCSDASIPGSNLPFVGCFFKKVGDLGILFPVLKLSSLSQLLVGNDIELVTVDLEPIEAVKQFGFEIPLFSFGIPFLAEVRVDAFLGGEFGFFVNFAGGFDTSGLHQNPKNFLDGLYLGDFDPGHDHIIQPTDAERVELGVSAGITVGIDARATVLGFDIAHVEGDGSLIATVGLDFNDDNDGVPLTDPPGPDPRTNEARHDGRLRLSEIGVIVASNGGNPLCVFDLAGQLTAALDLNAHVHIPIWGKETLASYHNEWLLLDFSLGCKPETETADLANIDENADELPILVLTSENSTSDQRVNLRSGTNHPDGDNVEVVLVDKNNDATDGGVLLDLARSDVTMVEESAGAILVTDTVGLFELEPQFKTRGIERGQKVRYYAGDIELFGILIPIYGFATISEATDNSFRATLDDPTLPIDPTSGFQVVSGRETLRVQKNGISEDFGPGESGGNFIANVQNFVLISDSQTSCKDGDCASDHYQLNGFGAGPDIVLIDPLITIPVFLHGGSGDDTVTGGSGGGTLVGSSGNDTLTFAAAPADLTAQELAAHPRTSLLDGGSGNDVLVGGPDDDVLLGGPGDDNLDGGTTTPRLSSFDLTRVAVFRLTFTGFRGLSGDDVLIGGSDRDFLEGRGGSDTLIGDFDGFRPFFQVEGPDVISAGDGDDLVWGDNRGTSNSADGPQPPASLDTSDQIVGGQGRDVIFAGAGNDVVDGDTSNGAFCAFGSHEDTAYGGTGNDLILGGASADVLIGESGDDSIEGGCADDDVFGGDNTPGPNLSSQGRDVLRGNAGDDFLDGSDSTYVIARGDDGSDLILGSRGADNLAGGAGRDFALGGPNNDLVRGDAGSDDQIGGSGIAGGFTLDFSPATADFGADGSDRLIGGPAFVAAGDSDDDVLLGDHGTIDDVTRRAVTDPLGGAGIDIMFGGADRDILFGAGRGDLMIGDAGDDILVGDQGIAEPGQVFTVLSSVADSSGNDLISGSDGRDIALGGDGDDSLNGDAEGDFLLGDHGRVTLSAGMVTHIESIDPTFGGQDMIGGGGGEDVAMGGFGNDRIDGGDNQDILFGDHARIVAGQSFCVGIVSIFTGPADGAGDDLVHGNAGDDVILGQQGSDQLFGDEDHDDLIGGHNVVGASDAADTMDGGSGHDELVGDNACIIRRSDALSPLMRVLAGTTLYNADGSPAVTATSQLHPAAVPGRDVTLFDHSTTTATGLFGSDNIAGGPGHDRLWGQLGDDAMQGDGSVAIVVSATMPSMEATTDGDDYMEGGGGSDLMFGNLGQDDVLGGSSNLFGLVSADQRPDGTDTMFGGAGTRTARNDAGDTAVTGHARDADVLLGDNGAVHRIVGTGGTSTGAFLSFNYDNYTPALRIIPRTIGLLDYTPGTGKPSDIGAGDVLHGEAGDDALYAAVGNDVLFGDGQDDDLFGGAGYDWMSGGTGHDGMLGDDGRIFASRNGSTEPLHNLTTPNVQTTISLPGNKIGAVVSITGRLTKEVKLTPFDAGSSDIMYGGLGDDFQHGGGGDDAMSGAEALPNFYNAPQPNPNPLGYDPATRKLAAYDANNPRTKIAGFLLNFEAYTNAANQTGTKVNDGKDRLFGDGGNDWLVGGTMNDRLFGGMGDDLMNADDNHDNGTTAGLNNRPDVPQFADGDFAFGGGGLDVLIANTGADRLFDWTGEFNSFIVPFSPFGDPTVNRTPGNSPHTRNFLLTLGDRAGADSSVSEPYGELGLVTSHDPQWHEQHGPPRDPQPGNVPGVQRDTQGGPENDTGNSNTYTLRARKSVGRSRQPVPQLTPEALAPIAVEATQRWMATMGGGAVDISSVTFQIADLPKNTLGQVAGTIVTLDATAAGYGWFIDRTPGDDAEFRSSVATTEWRAHPGSGASDHIDLLTVVMHELGHIAGLEHSGLAHDLMSDTLSSGVRRLPLVELNLGRSARQAAPGSSSLPYRRKGDAVVRRAGDGLMERRIERESNLQAFDAVLAGLQLPAKRRFARR